MAIFASRRVNVDPEPWVRYPGVQRLSTQARNEHAQRHHFKFDPRPEYGNRVNPVLAAYRASIGATPDHWIANMHGGTDEEKSHARKVLQKLANLS